MRQIEAQSFDLRANDRLLLCSDGLTEELSDQIIAFHLKTIRACDRAAAALVNAAKDRGGRDNITVVIVAVLEETRSKEAVLTEAFQALTEVLEDLTETELVTEPNVTAAPANSDPSARSIERQI